MAMSGNLFFSKNALYYRQLRDYTDAFLKLFTKIALIPSMIIMNIGGRGSGKTAQMFKLIELIRTNLPDRVAIVFWNAPETFIPKLIKYAPKGFSQHCYACNKKRKLTKIKKFYKHMILLYDEAQRDLNAKQFNSKANIGLEKLVAITRQQNIHMIYNTQLKNVTKNMRGMTDIRIYKGITNTFIQETDNKFVKTHARFIKNLMAPKRKRWCAFESSYAYFFHPGGERLIQSGKLDLDLYDYVPWWNEEISRAYEDVDLDFDFEEMLKRKPMINAAADLFLNQYPGITKGIKLSTVRGILRKMDEGLAYDVSPHMAEVMDEINARIFEDQYAKVEVPGTEDPSHAIIPQNVFQTDQTFAEYCQAYYLAQGKQKEATMCFMLLSHFPQDKVAPKVGLALGTLNAQWKILRETEMGYRFEEWCGLAFGLIVLGGNEHVLDACDKKGRLISIKSRYGRLLKQQDYTKSGDFGPANLLANHFHVNFGVLHFDLPWGDQDLKLVQFSPFPTMGSDRCKIARNDPSVPMSAIQPVPELQQVYESQGEDALKNYIIRLTQHLKAESAKA